MIVNQILQSAVLRAKTLGEELDEWLTLTASNGVLEKNHSQIDLVHKSFESALERLKERCQLLLDNASPGGISNEKFIEVAAIDAKVRQAYELWGSYRTWFAQRSVVRFSEYLMATDGIAHDCYHAVVERLVALSIDPKGYDLRSYPITAFDGRGDGPYTIPRGNRLRSTHVDALPVPMIAVPWNMQTMAWNCLAIHHEVGHDLDKDLRNPSSEIAEHLRKILQTRNTVEMRVQAWQRWRKEIVADYFGVLLGGPAYLGFMAAYLARHPHEVLDIREDAVHPVSYLRILLVVKFVESVWGRRSTEVNAYAGSIQDDWKKIYPSVKQFIVDFQDDFRFVVDALESLPLNCLTDDQSKQHALAELCPAEPKMFERQSNAANALLGDASYDIELRSPRLIPGAAQLAFERDPENMSLNASTLKAIIDRLPPGQLGDEDEQQQRRIIDRFVNNFFSDFEDPGI